MKYNNKQWNTIKKLIKSYKFPDAYRELKKINVAFAFDVLCAHLKKIRTETMVLFLVYANSIDEDISKYMCILNYLYFVAPYVVGNDILIAHFVYEALDFSPQNPRIISWVLNIYGGNPDCPFDEHDMSEFRSILRWTGTEKY